jgi:hypothetical protein
MDAYGLDPERVLHEPRPAEIPEGDYIAYRAEIVNGRFEAGAYDVALLRIDVAGEMPDPGAGRTRERMSLLGAARAMLTPTFPGLTQFPAIPGWATPVMTEALVSPVEDAPGRLLVGFTIEGEITLARGGYVG